MSKDRTAEMLNYLSALAREVGEFRQETKANFKKVEQRLDKVEQRLGNIEREQRQTTQRLDRMHGLLLTTRGDLGELEDRVAALEGEQT